MKKELTPKEYADLRGITLSAVTKQIREGRALPGVLEIKQFSRFYILVVDTSLIK